MAAGRVTLVDVSRRAGVSRTTASFVMSGRRDMRISADAEERVLRAARELNYRPNLMARGLRTKLTQTIGLVSDTIATEGYGGEMFRGSLATALDHNHLLFIGETEGDPRLEKRIVQDMLDRGVDGFVYAAMFTREVRPSPVLRGHPLVLVNCVTSNRRISAVIPDELAAGRDAVTALLEAGHDEGIWLAGETPEHVYAARQRRAGMESVLSAQALGLAGQVDCLWWPDSAYEMISDCLAGGHRPSALVCLNDRIALGAYQAINDAGLRIPEDVSVVSFDDSDLASWVRPGLTSVAIPHFELGRRAVGLLLSDQRSNSVQLVPMPLHTRDSIGPPRPAPAVRARAPRR